MNLPTKILALTLAGVLLVIAVPYGLVQLDVLPASILRIMPSVVAIILAIAFLAAVIDPARRKKKS